MSEVLVFGATSMVGSHFVQTTRARLAAAGRRGPMALHDRLDRYDVVDFDSPVEVERYVRSTTEPVIVNFAGRTDVDGVEAERRTPPAESDGSAWRVNTLAPEAIARAISGVPRFLVQVSTDFVFDGTKGPYAEADPRSPLSDRLSWYGWTKSEAERRVTASGALAAIVRISYPYRAGFPGKADLAHWVLSAFRSGALPPMFKDQQLSPTWVPDLSRALEQLVQRRNPGIYHVASPEVTTPLGFAREVVRLAGGDPTSVLEGSIRGSRPPGKAPRPVLGGLRSSGSAGWSPTVTHWKDGLSELATEEGWAR